MSLDAALSTLAQMRRVIVPIVATGFSLLFISGRASATQPTPVAVTYTVTLTGNYINLADADVTPKPIHFEKPVYPAAFRAAGIAGTALTEFVVDTSGTPTQVQVVHATDKAFAEAALEAVRCWRFTVGMKNGVAVRCRIQIPIVFKTKN